MKSNLSNNRFEELCDLLTDDLVIDSEITEFYRFYESRFFADIKKGVFDSVDVAVNINRKIPFNKIFLKSLDKAIKGGTDFCLEKIKEGNLIHAYNLLGRNFVDKQQVIDAVTGGITHSINKIRNSEFVAYVTLLEVADKLSIPLDSYNNDLNEAIREGINACDNRICELKFSYFNKLDYLVKNEILGRGIFKMAIERIAIGIENNPRYATDYFKLNKSGYKEYACLIQNEIGSRVEALTKKYVEKFKAKTNDSSLIRKISNLLIASPGHKSVVNRVLDDYGVSCPALDEACKLKLGLGSYDLLL